MPEKKRKKMTQRQKDERAAIKKRLQAEGLIPPDKKPLNRRKFAQEVREEFESYDGFQRYRIVEALGWMIPGELQRKTVTPEQVGVLKLMKIAVELDKFYKKLEAEDRSKYSLDEVWAIVKPILEL